MSSSAASFDDKRVPASSSEVPQPVTSSGHTVVPPAYHVETQESVLKAEALQRVWGPKSKIALWIGVALASYVYSLDGTTTYLYQAVAVSSFESHSILGAVSTGQAIVLATMKPVAAKLADTFGRAEAHTLAVCFYVLGYIVVASSSSINTYAAGAILFEVGYASLQILLQIVVGDVTSLRWRGLVSSSVSLPFFINGFVSSNIAATVLDKSGWRWGYGMFSIVVPAATLAIILTLFWAQHRARKLGVTATNYLGAEETAVAERANVPLTKRLLGHLVDLDAFGLLMFAAGWSCLLLPLTLVNGGHTTWNSHSVIAMLVCGPIILVAFVFYEAYLAKNPVFPLRLFKNKTIVAAALIGFFDFVSFYLQYTYQYSFIYVTHSDWSLKDQGYFGPPRRRALHPSLGGWAYDKEPRSELSRKYSRELEVALLRVHANFSHRVPSPTKISPPLLLLSCSSLRSVTPSDPLSRPQFGGLKCPLRCPRVCPASSTRPKSQPYTAASRLPSATMGKFTPESSSRTMRP